MRVICVTLLILSSFVESQSEGFQMVGPEASLVAVAGEDLVLPCFLKPSTSAVDMTVEWMRVEEVASLVHLYKDHKDRNEDQAQPYRGRTSLFKEELQKGNASLKLSPLRVSDEGEYKCLIEDKSWYDDIIVHIIVEAQGSHPVIMMESYDHSGGINLVCESRGWKPEPEVVWLDRGGAALPAEDTQRHRDTEGFSVKSRTTVYDYSDSNRYYCRLLQEHHMMETEVIINRKVFDAWRWVVGVSVSACLIAVGSIVTAVICYKKELQKQKQKAVCHHHLTAGGEIGWVSSELENYPSIEFPNISNTLVLQTSFYTEKQMKTWKSMEESNFLYVVGLRIWGSGHYSINPVSFMPGLRASKGEAKCR
ncbi:butyrophilin subfamily 1 member A1-like [Neoarius graeffei]|uniref:butyrophilin subfamily 1 member A1-like n=1 Tax=Neoarius graeffei TaxID=443677 RepID=UPI00298D2DE9|nr:butyrophilin subfamily 1 member A1-like [Neoarius graeffei]XP_060776068.1 butyrophilin subfamily 1 member A1-like [Neoarius graeffei]